MLYVVILRVFVFSCTYMFVFQCRRTTLAEYCDYKSNQIRTVNMDNRDCLDKREYTLIKQSKYCLHQLPVVYS